MKVNELVYSILDLLKETTDDSFYTEEFVLFLCKKYRSFLLKKEQEKEKGAADVASEFEYQEICLDLEKVAAMDGTPCTGGYYLRTTQAIPKILEGTQPKVYPLDYFQGAYVSFVGRDRMRHVGSNRYLQNIIYAALGPDLHLYLNSSNPMFYYLEGEDKLRMSAVFEDFDEAAKLSCSSDSSGEDTSCDVLDSEFPIRDYLVPTLIELVVKELNGSKYQPHDNTNNAKDDLPETRTQR